MRLVEFLDTESVSTGYYDPSQDKVNKAEITDTRKTRLTLSKLNRLKRMRALQKLENLKREDLLGVMYAPPEQPGGMGF